MGRRHGIVIEFGRTRVAKRRHPPKNREFEFVAKTVLNADVAMLLARQHMRQHGGGLFLLRALLANSVSFGFFAPKMKDTRLKSHQTINQMQGNVGMF